MLSQAERGNNGLGEDFHDQKRLTAEIAETTRWARREKQLLIFFAFSLHFSLRALRLNAFLTVTLKRGAWACKNNAMAGEQTAIPDFLYGTAWKEERTAALTEQALRAGFRGIDTANQRRHYFEAGVGQALSAAYRGSAVTRGDLFLQTKFTYQRGQDHRLPYDPKASFSEQVRQSLASSLEHLGTDYVDSFVLHGPDGYEWSKADAEVWDAMVRERAARRTRLLGVSNVSLLHLEQMAARHGEAPAFVQNRCFARMGWDFEVRRFCRERKIVYQGFSLLTANPEVVRHPLIASWATRERATPAQVVFRFAQAVGILPLTGTSNTEHMKQDLASRDLAMSAEEARAIEFLALAEQFMQNKGR